jgi:hypothetical protein
MRSSVILRMRVVVCAIDLRAAIDVKYPNRQIP